MILSAICGTDGKTVAVTLDDGVVLWIPDDIRNRHRVELAAWEADGNTIQPYVPPQETPVRNLDKEIDALKAVLVKKALLTDKDVEAPAAEAVVTP